MRRRVIPIVILSILLLACGEESLLGARVHEWTSHTPAREPQSWSRISLIVVDDDPALASAELRSTLTEGLARSLSEVSAGHDEARWRPFFWSVVIARPSLLGSTRFIGPSDDPRLRLDDENVDEDDEAVIVEALETWLTASQLGGPQRLLATAHDGLTLLLGQREPFDEREASLLSSLPQDAWWTIDVIVASLRPDESARPVEDYLPPSSAHERVSLGGTMTIFHSPLAECAPPIEGDGRLAEWGQIVNPDGNVGYPCGKPYLESRPLIFTGTSSGGYYDCLSHPIMTDSAGRALCHIIVRTRDVDRPCDPARGWLELPEDRFGEDDEGPYRRCSLRHVADDDIASCSSGVGCEDCSSGYCALRIPEGEHHCPRGKYPALRLVGGAFDGWAGFDVRCRLDP